MTVGLVALFATSPAIAQRINVSLDATSNDELGKQLASKFRQKVAASPLMTYVSDDNLFSVRIKLTTLDPDNDTPQSRTIYSAVYVLHPVNDGMEDYLASKVGTCGINKIDQCAESLIADTDEWAEMFRKLSTKSK